MLRWLTTNLRTFFLAFVLALAVWVTAVTSANPDLTQAYPNPIQIEFIGVRPGEKLFEEVTHKGENFAPTTHPKICRFISQPADLAQIRKTLQRLRANLHQFEADELKLMLKEAVPDYEPYLAPDNRIVQLIANPEDQHGQAGV